MSWGPLQKMGEAYTLPPEQQRNSCKNTHLDTRQDQGTQVETGEKPDARGGDPCKNWGDPTHFLPTSNDMLAKTHTHTWTHAKSMGPMWKMEGPHGVGNHAKINGNLHTSFRPAAKCLQKHTHTWTHAKAQGTMQKMERTLTREAGSPAKIWGTPDTSFRPAAKCLQQTHLDTC